MDNKKLEEINIVENLLSKAQKTNKDSKDFFILELELYKDYYPEITIYLDNIARIVNSKYNLTI